MIDEADGGSIFCGTPNPAGWAAILAAASGGGTDAEREAIHPLFRPLIASPGALVIGQVGQSLDGRIATANGHSHYVNGSAAIAHLHRLRALVDAVVVGVGTALADNPQLTVREAPGPSPARVVIDPRGRLPASAKLLGDDGCRRLVIGLTRRLDLPAGVEQVVLETSPDGMISPADVVTALTDCGLRRLLIEGGAATVSRFLQQGCLDRLHIAVAPILIGAGPTGISLPPIARMDQALRAPVALYRLDQDILYDLALSGG